jgi:uncharacterized protein with GYD domain
MMPTYVLMTKLDPAEARDPKGRRQLGEEWKRAVDARCPGIRWLAHYALLGPYDFLDLYEAPDQETAFKVSIVSRELGAATAESWPALAWERYVPVFESADVT